MEETRIHGSRRMAMLALGVGGAALVLALFLEPPQSWLVLAVGLLLIGVNVIALLDRRAKLSLSSQGIRYASWGPATHPWQEFSGFRWVTWRNGSFLQLVPRRPSELVASFSWSGKFGHYAARLVRGPVFSIQAFPLEVSDGELTALVGGYLPEEPGAGAA